MYGPRACYDDLSVLGKHCVNFARHHRFDNYCDHLTWPRAQISGWRVVSDCINILNGEDIVLLSDGSASRTCYNADAVHGYVLVLLSGLPGDLIILV